MSPFINLHLLQRLQTVLQARNKKIFMSDVCLCQSDRRIGVAMPQIRKQSATQKGGKPKMDTIGYSYAPLGGKVSAAPRIRELARMLLCEGSILLLSPPGQTRP